MANKELNGFTLVLCTATLTHKKIMFEPENLTCSEAEIYF